MKSFEVGALSSKLTLPAIILGVLGTVLISALLGYRAWTDSSDECVRCHANRAKMEELKAPWAYMTDEIVRKESRHPHILCRDCHLGNGRARSKEDAHKGMLKMLIVSEQGRLLRRNEGYPHGLGSTGDDRLLALLPKVSSGGKEVRNILWHDRDPETFDFDPRIAEKTCGRKGCHAEALPQFRTSAMGRNHRQRLMRSWLEPYGPHNCGPSFADQAPAGSHDKPSFDFSNTGRIQEETGAPFSREQAKDKQKFCNVCHTGCLDCHYTPGYAPKKSKTFPGGIHSFSRIPPAESCAGFGRGSSICHPGSMQSRRGETYIGGDYSVPQGMKPDVHYKKGLGCIECHPTGEGGMGHMERKASCRDCHLEIEDAHSRDVHRAMDCATCHIRELRGYQITAWGPGKVAGRENPFTKYSLYYGTQSPPLLIKDRKGIWMPVKVWPHSLGGFKKDAAPSKGLQFRWPDGETRDAYSIIGTFEIPGGPGRQLLWLEIQQAAHPFGPARKCSSCHASSRQAAASRWQFLDDQGAAPFSGKYRVIADEKGLRITGLAATSPINMLPGYKLTDFAPWLFLKDKWTVPGDFSIKADPEKYRKYLHLASALEERIKALDSRSVSFDKKTRRTYQTLRKFALHNPEEGLKRMKKEFPGLK